MAVVIGIVLVCALIYAIGMYNELVSLRRQTANAWSQIDIQLRTRYELIPNLIEAVKGVMRHEQDTFDRLIRARNEAIAAATVAERGRAESAVQADLSRVFVILANLPDLTSGQNVLALQADLKSTEDKIAFARRYYNEVVTAYNIRLETFPSSLVGKSFGFRHQEMFLIEELKERENVRVAF